MSDSFSGTERKAYDANLAGQAAPATAFTSKNGLEKYLTGLGFEEVQVQRMNSDAISYRGKIFLSRKWALKIVGPLFGLDLYVIARKRPLDH